MRNKKRRFFRQFLTQSNNSLKIQQKQYNCVLVDFLGIKNKIYLDLLFAPL